MNLGRGKMKLKSDCCGTEVSWEEVNRVLERFIKTYDIIDFTEWLKAHGIEVKDAQIKLKRTTEEE